MLVVTINIHIPGFAHEEHFDHEGDGRDLDRVPQTVTDIVILGHEGERNGQRQAPKPVVVDVIRQ